jgi:protein-L-isoaspartate(D-aspartate) O-methyltransferase
MDRKDLRAEERERMVAEQIAWRDVGDERVLDAMRSVPRHRFVPPEFQHLAYSDGPLRIGEGQTISQPYIVALMTELLELRGDENVLEVGTGSGYQAAILSRLADEVHTVERHETLAFRAEQILTELGCKNVKIHIGDGSLGYPRQAPYHSIIVTASAPQVPQPLLDQLADQGRLVLPVGGRASQVLQRWRRQGDKFTHESLVPVAFVPLLGKHGWQEDKEERFGWW